jgi:hypothetical protein
LRIAGVGALPEQRCDGDDHPINAVATLSCLFLKESALNGMQLTLFDQTFQSGDTRPADLRDWQFTGWPGLISDQYHTGATGFLATTELGTGQSQFIA